MTVYDLNREQLIELKQAFITEQYDERGESPSWGELVSADELVTDEQIYAAYEAYSFTPDDFACSAGQDEDDNDTTLEDKLLALEARVRFIENSSYIPFVSPYPSSTEKRLADCVRQAANLLNQAAQCAHLLRY